MQGDLNLELNKIKQEYNNLVNLNSNLNRKLERYYKTGKIIIKSRLNNYFTI